MADWHNKIVVITGGSEGLGYALAVDFGQRGASVVILARDPVRLDEVCIVARSHGWKFDSIVADVTDDDSVKQAVAEIMTRHGRIDVWINNVGKSTRTSLLDCDVAQYQSMMEINFYSAVRCTLAVLPHLVETSGHLVNIGSLAAKTGWVHVAPYATSKHALAAFNHQLRLEGPSNVHFLLVCPGPIRRTDAATRYAAESASLDSSANQPGGGVKLKGISAEKLAAKIERATQRRKSELIVPGYTRILFALLQLAPKLADWILLRSKKK